MQVAPGAEVVATLVAPGDLDLGARIEVPGTRAIASYWRRATHDPATGEWTVRLESPVTPVPVDAMGPPAPRSDFVLAWRDGGPEPPAFETLVPLTVA